MNHTKYPDSRVGNSERPDFAAWLVAIANNNVQNEPTTSPSVAVVRESCWDWALFEFAVLK